MPLPTWYRFLRALPAGVGGLVSTGFGIYLVVAPTSYRDPNDPKMVAYTNSLHPVVIGLGVFMILVGLALLYIGVRFYSRLPEGLREYSYEQLRLGQELARQILRLSRHQEFNYWSDQRGHGSEIRVSSWSYSYRRRNFIGRIRELPYGFGGEVSFTCSQAGTEADGTLYVPEVTLSLDSFSGKAERREVVAEYQIVESPPLVGEDSPLAYAIREMVAEGDLDENEADFLTEPRFELVHKSIRRDESLEEWVARRQFMKQMGLDKPSVEELQIAIDQLREW